jgi:hypothetical protein
LLLSSLADAFPFSHFLHEHPFPLPFIFFPPLGFNGNQTALWTSTNSKGNSFLINVHGTQNVLVGDVTIPAYTPIEEEWFCDGFSALLGA